MKEQFIKVVRKSGTSLAINIPIEITDMLNINSGDVVRVKLEKIKKYGNK